MYECKIDGKKYESEEKLIKHMLEEHSKGIGDKKGVVSYDIEEGIKYIERGIKGQGLGVGVKILNRKVIGGEKYSYNLGVKIDLGKGDEVELKCKVSNQKRTRDSQGNRVYTTLEEYYEDIEYGLKNLKEVVRYLREKGYRYKVRGNSVEGRYIIEITLKDYEGVIYYGIKTKGQGCVDNQQEESLEETLMKYEGKELQGEVEIEEGYYSEGEEEVRVTVGGIDLVDYIRNKRVREIRVEIVKQDD